jgi:hypothetical protein
MAVKQIVDKNIDSIKYTMVIVHLIVLWFMYKAYTYLTVLQDCSCASSVREYVTNIRSAQYFLVFLSLLGLLPSLLSIFVSKTSSIMVALEYIRRPHIGILSTLYALFMLYVYYFFVTNVHQFHLNVPSGCECINKWPIDILYLQAINYFILLSLVFISMLLLIVGFFV